MTWAGLQDYGTKHVPSCSKFLATLYYQGKSDFIGWILKASLPLRLCKMSHCCTLEGAQLNFALFKISFGPIILFPSPTLRYIPRHFVQISKHFLLFFNTNEVGIEFNAMKLFTMATNMSILYDTWIVQASAHWTKKSLFVQIVNSFKGRFCAGKAKFSLAQIARIKTFATTCTISVHDLKWKNEQWLRDSDWYPRCSFFYIYGYDEFFFEVYWIRSW